MRSTSAAVWILIGAAVVFAVVVSAFEPTCRSDDWTCSKELRVRLNNGEEVVVHVPGGGRELLPASKRFLGEGGPLFELAREECGRPVNDRCVAALQQQICETMAAILINYHEVAIRGATAAGNVEVIRSAIDNITADIDTADCFVDVELQQDQTSHSVVYGLGINGTRCFQGNTECDIPDEYFLNSSLGGIVAYLGDRGAKSPRMDANIRSLLESVAEAFLKIELADRSAVRGDRLFGIPASLICLTFVAGIDPVDPANSAGLSHEISRNLEHLQYLERSTFRGFERSCYGNIIRDLTHRMYSARSYVEGGIFNADSSYPGVLPANRKRECYAAALLDELSLPAFAIDGRARSKHRVVRTLEIGFNGGHSSAVILSLTAASRAEACHGDAAAVDASPQVKVVAFDICRHSYTSSNAEYLNTTSFGLGRLELRCGDSQTDLPRYAAEWKARRMAGQNDDNSSEEDLEPPFSLVFVDGNHSYHAALSDLEASRSVSAPGALVIVDDCDQQTVARAWRQFLSNGGAVPYRRGVCWESMCIGRFM